VWFFALLTVLEAYISVLIKGILGRVDLGG